MANNDTRTLQDMTISADCLPDTRFNELINLFTLQHFATLLADNFPFYRNAVSYGELVVIDQVINTTGNPTPREPSVMRFVHPSPNQYALFLGQLYHGVIG